MLPKRKIIPLSTPTPGHADTDPDHNPEILDGKTALRASPDADEKGEALNLAKVLGKDHVNGAKPSPVKRKRAEKVKLESGVKEEDDSDLSELPEGSTPKKPKKTLTKSSIAAKKGSDEIKAFKASQAALKAAVKKEDGDEGGGDPEGEEGVVEDGDAEKREANRAPAVNSDYLPLPWKGRLGYACLNTYLRFSNPPIFSSRTCRIASILEHRHPLTDPTLPEHATKNRPDKTQPASLPRGMQYVHDIGLANARDIVKMLRWNERYGIRFLRLSSEMFPFASHEEYGYDLRGFAGEVLAEAGRVAGELGHRLTTHPGQFTQLGSPRQAVIDNAIRDLEYHDSLLSLLALPEQLNRDAVMILHLGGTFGDKAATIERFKTNYSNLSQGIKNRLVLENDDVSWSVHDLLPICEELNIPLVLDFHHHNIIFDSTQLREGTKDIMDLYPRIKATWTRKGITQKMHYSEPCPEAITGRQRRKHNPRPATMPPCAEDMDLMIEAKDKEQAVFELMRTFKLPGFETFNTIIPYERADDNKPEPRKAKKKKTKAQIKAEELDPSLIEPEEPEKATIPEEDVGMGGPQGRVYWPPGMEHWLRSKKREVKKKTEEEEEAEVLANPTPMNLKQRQEIKRKRAAGVVEGGEAAEAQGEGEKKPVVTPRKRAKKAVVKKEAPQTPSMSDKDDRDLTEEEDSSLPDLSASDEDAVPSTPGPRGKGKVTPRRQASKKVSYAEGGDSNVDMH